MSDKGDSRRLQRAEASQEILVMDILRDIEVGRIVNLHEEGFMVIGGDVVKENCLYQMKLVFSEPIDGVNAINVGAECLWVRETAGEDLNWAGFHIMDISAEDMSLISLLKNTIDE